MNTCLNCGRECSRKVNKFCSNRCQSGFQYSLYIEKWKNGKVDGGRGINTRNIAWPVIRYLHAKYKSCTLCGWNQINPVTNKVPLEIDHIDGNSENNVEENLRLICPNCHSLSPNFRNLNKGNGSSWRRLKYIKQQ